MAKLNRAADKLNTALTGVNDVLSPKNKAAITSILANLDTTTGVFSKRSHEIDSMLVNFDSASAKLNGSLDDLHTTILDADKAVNSVTVAVGHIDAQVASAQVGQLSSDLRSLVHSLSRISNQLEAQPTRLLFGDRREGYTPK
jgi:phospholipid/cholesterol/gamma-HCH transport system substrate-binding protein